MLHQLCGHLSLSQAKHKTIDTTFGNVSLIFRNAVTYIGLAQNVTIMLWCFCKYYLPSIVVCHLSLIQAETHDGIPANQTKDVIHKNDKDYGFICLNEQQAHGLCHNYRVRFLCGKLGTYMTSCLYVCGNSVWVKM